MQEISWTDLPQHNLIEVLHDYDSMLDALNKIIQNYHKIQKISWKLIDLRIRYLSDIREHALKIYKNIDQDYLYKVAFKISKIAESKINYLRKLEYLNAGGFQKQKQMILDPTHISDKFTPLILNNVKKYNYKTEEIWGEYLIEGIDPCHRRLMNSYYDLWFREFTNDYLPNFFLWLEDKNISVLHPMIKLFSPDDLDKHKVTIKEGKLYYSKNNLISTQIDKSNDFPSKGPSFYKEHIFIIDGKAQVYLCYSNREIAHPSLSHYRPIIGSGKIFLEEGIIKRISFDSGHYLPNGNHCVQNIKLLQSKGVQFNSQIRVDYFNDYKYLTTTFKNFVRALNL